MEREVNYERTLTGSYITMEAPEESLDERIIRRRTLTGILPMEKCFVNGTGVYRFEITGRQSLDTRCLIRPVKLEEIDRLILSICSCIEQLERYLISADCLVLDPELIFYENQTKDLHFMLYPDKCRPLSAQFRELMEYLLAKLDHKDQQAVKKAYALYEITMDEGYSLRQIREAVVSERKEEAKTPERLSEGTNVPETALENPKTLKNPYAAYEFTDPDDKGPLAEPEKEAKAESKREKKKARKQAAKEEKKESRRLEKERREKEKQEKKEKRAEKRKEGLWARMIRKIRIIIHEQMYGEMYDESIYGIRLESKEDDYYVDMSFSEEPEEEPMPAANPTVCLGSYTSHPEGILLYEGPEAYTSLPIKKESVIIGKGAEAGIVIDRNTISSIHARISKEEDTYYIEDLNSMNGTYVNENPVLYRGRQPLKVNDIIRFADLKYRFV